MRLFYENQKREFTVHMVCTCFAQCVRAPRVQRRCKVGAQGASAKIVHLLCKNEDGTFCPLGHQIQRTKLFTQVNRKEQGFFLLCTGTIYCESRRKRGKYASYASSMQSTSIFVPQVHYASAQVHFCELCSHHALHQRCKARIMQSKGDRKQEL